MIKLREVNLRTLYGAGEKFEKRIKTLFRSLGMKRPFSGTRNTFGRINDY
jgi:hypothetical protein